MAFNPPRPLVDGQLVTNSTATYYTANANQRTQVGKATAHNTDSAASIALTVWLVESGGSASDANQVYKQTLGPLETVYLDGVSGAALSAAGTIQAVAGTTNKISLNIAGTEYSV